MLYSADEIDFSNPSSLFRYCAVNKNTLSALIMREFWLARPESFNDPFDSVLIFDRDISDEALVNWLNHCAVTQGKEPSYTPESAPEQRRIVEEILEKAEAAIANAGVFSLSATPLEILLWSHYADRHRGICIEFERSPDNELGGSTCKPVMYVDDLCPAVGGLEFFKRPEDVLSRVLYSKARSWQYEHEWRLAYVSRAPGALKRAHRLSAPIKSVLFGLRTPPADMNTIARILGVASGIEFYKMSTPPTRFILTPVVWRPDRP